MGRYGYRNADGVATIARLPTALEVRCQACDWYHDPEGVRPYLAARSAARRHVASTGHRVTVQRCEAFVYGPEPDELPDRPVEHDDTCPVCADLRRRDML